MEVLFLGQDNTKIKKVWETICKEAQVSVKKSNYMKGYFSKNILGISLSNCLHVFQGKMKKHHLFCRNLPYRSRFQNIEMELKVLIRFLYLPFEIATDFDKVY